MDGDAAKSRLPDPTADLDWSNFRGAIHDIFAQNAERHPDRPFITETASSSVPQRQFTYQQIHESSNLLAHHLIEHDIGQGDVVMIYAYRGVDLVVAILGVLKSGAAFSVIDPAYPPDRQCIYLDVAQPAGLIVIEKASREDGQISAQVRTWMSENLKLRAEVPALELLDDGTLNGGCIVGHTGDCLGGQQALKSKHPGVIVGPDSQPTLSFTSGSEGRPKGVRGRHYSLTYYTPWMARTFNLTEHDRFTMLSGIAHDPIQRDCFTPMFLGAQLLIPAKEDIQHERLAAWMARHKGTVTHLTPAMGQILVGGADTQFDSLHHAFFVGDVLMRRDCRVLQNLAPNCRAVNMFGTTETQRAVSYFEIPARNEDASFLDQMPDVIPAGRGMENVQLLVVDRTSLENGRPKLCPGGEIGEIYVRAGGLAEGYLGSDDLNKEKFVSNFFVENQNHWAEKEAEDLKASGEKKSWHKFWRGPRDRLYRSGDLGRYLESGDVECTGRADNQVKIRGFRIELGEIDTYLSQHPLIRENVTLVRRNKDEEPILVSYFVADTARWRQWLQDKGINDEMDDGTLVGLLKRFRLLRDDARTRLREKLPPYAVPVVFIPLKAMPITPNYKIDRKALPYPDAAELAASVPSTKSMRDDATSTQKAVAEIWATRLRLPLDSVDLDGDFFELGGHSLRAQEVIFDIKRWAGISLSVATLFQNPTVRKLAAALDVALGKPQQEVGAVNGTPIHSEYAADGETLRAESLPNSFPDGPRHSQTILLTGATGFLGAGILVNLLNRDTVVKVITLVRAKSETDALRRVRTSCAAYHHWSEDWVSRLECIPADISEQNLGLSTETWHILEEKVDIVIHNAAIVHWIKLYSALRPTNVLSTLFLLKLCAKGRPKHLSFISSTAVLDSGAYGSSPIPESDNLSRSRTGLSSGYAQTKYVSEYLVREAGKKGLRTAIIRPGYITGNADTGVGPTDDFLLRMLKGSVQLSCRPDLGETTINLVPVSYCVDVVVSASLQPLHHGQTGTIVYQVTPHPQLAFNSFLATLESCGYVCPLVPYRTWCSALEKYVAAETTLQSEPHALLPLFEWVTDDLPAECSSKVLDDANTQALLKVTGTHAGTREAYVMQETVKAYLAFMVSIGFLTPPPPPANPELEGKPLIGYVMDETQKKALGEVGRGGS